MRGNRVVRRAILTAAAVIVLAGCSSTPTPDTPKGGPSSSQVATDPPRDTATPEAIQPFVVVAGLDVDGRNVTVSGYVAGIVEDGGTCTFVLTGPTTDHSVSGDGHADVSSTSCGSQQILRTDLTGGEWKVVLEYTAVDGSTTHSAPHAMELP